MNNNVISELIIGLILLVIGLLLEYFVFQVIKEKLKGLSAKRTLNKIFNSNLATIMVFTVAIFLCSALALFISFSVKFMGEIQETKVANLTMSPKGSIIAQSTVEPTPQPMINNTPTYVNPSSPTQTLLPLLPATSTISPTQPPTETATAPLPNGLLYKADWSKGMNGWAGSHDWKNVNGMLVNDGTGFNSFILAPFHPGDHGISNYAIESEIQVPNGITEGFGLVARWKDVSDSDQSNGYFAGIGYVSWEGNPAYISVGPPIFLGMSGGRISLNSYSIDNQWHTYRFELSGNEYKLLIDGAEILHGSNNQFLDGGDVRIWCSKNSLNIRSFEIRLP